MRDDPVDANDGGESACFAHLICPECGVVLDGADHRQTCTWVNPQGGIDPMDMVEPSPED